MRTVWCGWCRASSLGTARRLRCRRGRQMAHVRPLPKVRYRVAPPNERLSALTVSVAVDHAQRPLHRLARRRIGLGLRDRAREIVDRRDQAHLLTERRREQHDAPATIRHEGDGVDLADLHGLVTRRPWRMLLLAHVAFVAQSRSRSRT